MSEEWTEKYRPRKLDEVVGNQKAIEELRMWSEDVSKSGFKKAVILYGGPGVGKTSSAHALAMEKGWEIIELNASDQRNERVIKSIVGPASSSNTFSKATRLIILDEADNILGKEDQGGTKAITEIVKRSSQPIILIANDLYKMGTVLKQRCKLIPFQKIKSVTIFRVLKRICAAEGIEIEDNTLHLRAQNANRDMRSAINDLQAAAMTKKEISEGDIATGGRDVRESIFNVLNKIFRGYDMQEALYSLYNLDDTPEQVIRWIYANLATEYGHDKGSLIRGLHYLSQADVFLGRARRRDNFLFWRYATSLMACGVLCAKKGSRTGNGEYRPHYQYQQYQTPWSKSKSQKTSALQERIAKKLGEYCHVPLNEARFFRLPCLQMVFRDERKAVDIARLLRLDIGEIAFLDGDTDNAERIYQKATMDKVEVTAIKQTMTRDKEVEKEDKEVKKDQSKMQKTLAEFF